MERPNLRTYRRREVTRTSGYSVIGTHTGGEAIVVKSEKYTLPKNNITFKFKREQLSLVELFEQNKSILGFGGYIYTDNEIKVDYKLSFMKNDMLFTETHKNRKNIEKNNWSGIGFHREFDTNKAMFIEDVVIEFNIYGETGTNIEFISFDFDILSKVEFLDSTFSKHFYQKTTLHIPYIYYLETDLSFNEYLINDNLNQSDRIVVLKSCNRCGRFNPINYFHEEKTLTYSLHCKKNAPCKHAIFGSYTIENIDELTESDLNQLNLNDDDKLVSYYGHQLECKACKKFFVNAALNPQRNTQQFREDSLRRRAIEVLVNNLYKTNLIHFEFESKTKKEFSKHIWEKFDKKCFKCNKSISLGEMHLDHTMPLAYLYRLDESATCLCADHNLQKSDNFPVDFYSESELIELSTITGLSYEILNSREANPIALKLLKENVVWYFDNFLAQPEYQKERDGILTANKINDSIKRVIGSEINLEELYFKIKNIYPKTITVNK